MPTATIEIGPKMMASSEKNNYRNVKQCSVSKMELMFMNCTLFVGFLEEQVRMYRNLFNSLADLKLECCSDKLKRCYITINITMNSLNKNKVGSF